MICEILCVGTEILLGDIVNTDAAFIAKELASLGFASYHQSVVGDNPERLRAAISEGLRRSDVLIITGGLGPTCDDITKVAAAEAFGRKMHRDMDVQADIEEFFRKIGREMTENNLQQADIPDGATVFYNKWGTAPGIALDGIIDGKMKYAILLPGPPSECEPMFVECAEPYLRKFSPHTIYSLNLHMYAIGESGAEQILRPMMEQAVNPTIAPYACEHEVRIRVTAFADTLAEAKKLCRDAADKIYASEAGQYIYTETDTPDDAKNAVVLALIRELRNKGTTLATAESCTAGMIASRIGDIPGASDVLLGGIVSYANSVKTGVLGVPEAVLESHGAVSEQCAVYMAEGARRITHAGITVSVTGIAGPDGGTPEKPVGTVCFAVSDDRGTVSETAHFNGKNDRAKIRRLTAARAMMLVIRRLRDSDAQNPKQKLPIIESGIERLRDPCILYENGVYYAYGTGWVCYRNTSGALDGKWEGPLKVVELPSDHENDDNRWAPEVHKYNGEFYMFTTYHSSKTGHRGCTIFKSGDPMGPFTEITGGQITPHDWDAIDGTLYVDPDGQPWMVFVHEWTCTDDGIGRMACAKLSKDLTKFVSEPVELFRADDPSWSTNRVTDGCWLYTTESGSLLMLWSNWDKYGYCVGIARSESGLVTGPWIQEDALLYSKSMTGKYDGGHGMIFRHTSGQLYLSIHSPNSSKAGRAEMPVFIPIKEENDTLIWE